MQNRGGSRPDEGSEEGLGMVGVGQAMGPAVGGVGQAIGSDMMSSDRSRKRCISSLHSFFVPPKKKNTNTKKL